MHKIEDYVALTHPRPKAPSHAASIVWQYPDIELVEKNGTIETSLSLDQSQMDAIRLAYYKFLLTKYYMEVGNALQLRALSYHTISEKTASIQQDLYEYKFREALKYVGGDIDVPLIQAEANVLGVSIDSIAVGVIENYRNSQTSLFEYYGLLEGTRRLVKRRILEATSIEELDSMSTVILPLYEPKVAPDLDA